VPAIAMLVSIRLHRGRRLAEFKDRLAGADGE
jgi:hypothetical protein